MRFIYVLRNTAFQTLNKYEMTSTDRRQVVLDPDFSQTVSFVKPSLCIAQPYCLNRVYHRTLSSFRNAAEPKASKVRLGHI